MKYKIVSQRDENLLVVREYLEHAVNKLCKEGWKPQGGITITKGGSKFPYYEMAQAMVKDD